MELGAEEAYYIPLDMSILGDAKRLIDEAKMTLGGIDHLVLNHITSNYMKVWNGDFERLQNVMDVNFRSYVALATHATPMLNETRGSMTVLISLAGKTLLIWILIYQNESVLPPMIIKYLKRTVLVQDLILTNEPF